MTTTKRFAFCLALGFCFIAAARAQTPRVSTVNVTPEPGRVRVAAVGEVYDLKVEVVDEAGETIFEGRQAGAGPLDWNLRDARGVRVAPSAYTVTVSYATQAGKQRKRIEQVLVTEQAGESAPAEAPSAAGPTPQTVGTITGEGSSGKLAKFTGANAIANSGVTEYAGKIGIGTATPGYKLTVNSGGTTVISATNTAAGNPGGNGITGTGAPGVPPSGSALVYGGVGVVGRGGRGGNSTSSGGGQGGGGVVGTGGDAGSGPDGSGNGGAGVSGVGGSPNGTGVSGIGSAPFGIGVYGRGPNIGVLGDGELDGAGVDGRSSHGPGVVGLSDTGNGVSGFSSSGNGVRGSSISGYAGYFDGRVNITGQTTIETPSTLSFGSSTRQMLNLWSTQYGIGVQANVQYFRTNSGFAWYRGGAHNNAEFSNGGGVTLMRLDSSGNLYTLGAINPPSDRALKANFSAVDTRSVLERLARVPVQSWSYKADGAGVRHLGPVAQDFKAAFQLGADDKTIATVDADGVMMASIQALYQMMREKDAQIARLQSQLNQVRRVVRRGRTGKR